MKDVTEICVIIDRSGSMSGRQDDTIGGFNAFLKQQKELPGEANMTIVLFDDQYEVLTASQPIKDVADLTEKTYFVRGQTRLNDSVGKAMTDLEIHLAAIPEQDRPSKVIVAILTDGGENDSREFDHAKIVELIQRQRDIYDWEILFLAAGQDAWNAGVSLGINMAIKGVMFTNSTKNVQAAYASVSTKVCGLRRSADMTSYKSSTLSMSEDFSKAGGDVQNPPVQEEVDPSTGQSVAP
jgi:uncharacterized protein YegL